MSMGDCLSSLLGLDGADDPDDGALLDAAPEHGAGVRVDGGDESDGSLRPDARPGREDVESADGRQGPDGTLADPSVTMAVGTDGANRGGGEAEDIGDPGGGEEREPAGDPGVLRQVAVDRIEPNERQPRRRFTDGELDALAGSIAEVGVLQPLLVRRIDDGRYELIAGERRLRAAKLAGLTTVPAVVRRVDDQTSLEQAIVENLHRADLNPVEEAAGYRQLMEEFALTQEEVAQRVGRSRPAVANLLRLLHLPPGVQRLIVSGQLSAGHARAVLALPDPRQQEAVATRIVRDGLNVRDVEALIRSLGSDDRQAEGTGRGRRSPRGKSVAALEVERALAEVLGTSVEVRGAGGRGTLVIDFADPEDLERIYQIVLR